MSIAASVTSRILSQRECCCPSRRAAIIAAVKTLLAAGALAAAFGVLVVLYFSARTRGLEAYCRNNMRQLGDLAWRNRNSIDPQRTGRDFWQAVREAQYRDVRGKWQAISPDPFVCPVLGTTVSRVDDAMTIDFRGPARLREQFEQTPKAEPIGADRPGNHPSGGHVLRLDTSVQDIPKLVDRVKDGDPLWGAAASALKD
jgi:hypothetical protein